MGDVEGPIEQKDVGLGVTGHLFNPENPQEHLQNSFHPYAPFPGNALKWRSNLYADGTT